MASLAFHLVDCCPPHTFLYQRLCWLLALRPRTAPAQNGEHARAAEKFRSPSLQPNYDSFVNKSVTRVTSSILHRMHHPLSSRTTVNPGSIKASFTTQQQLEELSLRRLEDSALWRMSMDFGLKGVHVLVTGAAGGIGLETVHTFRQLGARVTAHYNSKLGELESLKDVVSLQADVRDEASVGRLLQQAAEQNGGPVSVLVVNHGIWPSNNSHLADMDIQQWQNTLAVNLTGPFLLCKAYLQALREAPQPAKDAASIIFIGSTAGKFGEANHGDYAAAKSALMYGLVPTLKNEIVSIAPRGRVNSINPGWVATPMAEETLKDTAFVERALATTPLQKVGTPADIARQIAVIASPVLSGHVNGQNIMVDGGMEGRLLFPPKAQ